MPLEINEVGIRMQVSDAAEKEVDSTASNLLTFNQENNEKFDPCNENTNASKDKIVEDCVRQVLKILKAQKVR